MLQRRTHGRARARTCSGCGWADVVESERELDRDVGVGVADGEDDSVKPLWESDSRARPIGEAAHLESLGECNYSTHRSIRPLGLWG